MAQFYERNELKSLWWTTFQLTLAAAVAMTSVVVFAVIAGTMPGLTRAIPVASAQTGGTVDLVMQAVSTTVNMGDEFDVILAVQAGSQEVDTASAFVDFDPSVLQVVSISPGSILPVELNNEFDNVTGEANFEAGKLGSPFPSGAFTLATIRFEAIAPSASSSLTFHISELRVTDIFRNGVSVLDSAAGIGITVNGNGPRLVILPASTIINEGEQFDLVLEVQAGSQEVDTASAFVDFDPSVLQVISITGGSTLPVELNKSFDNGTGTVDYEGGKLGAPFPNGTFTLATVRFEATGISTGTALTFSNSGLRTTALFRNGGSLPVGVSGSTVTIQSAPDGPELGIPNAVTTYFSGTVSIPVTYTANGSSIAALTFSIDFDETCLEFDGTDSNGDDIPDAIHFDLPAAFGVSATYEPLDSGGELDLFIADTFPPLSALTSDIIATVDFRAACQPAAGATITAPVAFSSSPDASFGSTTGTSVPGSTVDGSVRILSGKPGDGNGDQVVDAGDITACVLEIFDGDGDFWLNAPGGTFPGNPVGCDANKDTKIDAGDVVCTVLIIFGGPNACPGASVSATSQATLTIPDEVARTFGRMVQVPVVLDSVGNPVAAATFAVAFDKSWLQFDPSDNDGDGVPDAVTVHLSQAFDVMVGFDETNDVLEFAAADTSVPLSGMPNGPLLTLNLEVIELDDRSSGTASVYFAGEPVASLGDYQGGSVPVQVNNGSVLMRPSTIEDGTRYWLRLPFLGQ